LHGIGKKEWNSGRSVWGQYKNDKMEGYLTVKDSDGIVSYYQFKNGRPNGYGIRTNYDGEEYLGEFKDG
jgi:hypothetical protein